MLCCACLGAAAHVLHTQAPGPQLHVGSEPQGLCCACMSAAVPVLRMHARKPGLMQDGVNHAGLAVLRLAVSHARLAGQRLLEPLCWLGTHRSDQHCRQPSSACRLNARQPSRLAASGALLSAAWRLMGKDMYEGMSALSEETAVIARGMALHKVIRLITMAIGEPGLAMLSLSWPPVSLWRPHASCAACHTHTSWPADLVSTRWPPAGFTDAFPCATGPA